MDAFVHFVVGFSGCLLFLLFVDLRSQEEFAIAISSGVWALIPDLWWGFREFGYESAALVGRGFHQSVFANLFWFHRLIDRLETGRPKLELGMTLGLIVCSSLCYYAFNNWDG